MKAKSALEVHRIDAERVLGISARALARLEAEGIIVPKKRGKPGVPSVYDLAVIVPGYIEHVRAATNHGGDREARARRDTAQAELHELRLSEQRKELLPRDDVVREGKTFIVATRAKLLSLPRRLVQAGHVTPDKQPAIALLIREALEEMARWKTQGDLREAAQGRG